MMPLPLPEDSFPETLVVGDEDTLFVDRDFQHAVIVDAAGFMKRGEDVMPLLS